MEKCRNVRVGEDVWARLKQRALDERVTVREVTERAVSAYLGVMPTAGEMWARTERPLTTPKELKYDPTE
jgi:hypothetical protein